MSAIAYRSPSAHTIAAAAQRSRNDPAYGAYLLLRVGFTALPIVFGIDKFANVLVHWDRYLAPWLDGLSPFTAHNTMWIVGVVEIIAGLAVAIKPRYGSYIVAAWLAGIVINLFTFPGFYDIALRDFGLMLAALTLARLANLFDPPWMRPAHGDAAPLR